MSSKGGGVTGTVVSGSFKYFWTMVFVGLLFGTSLMLDLNHAIFNLGANVVGAITGELPVAADTVQRVRTEVGADPKPAEKE